MYVLTSLTEVLDKYPISYDFITELLICGFQFYFDEFVYKSTIVMTKVD